MNDDELLDALGRSLHAPDAEPSPVELAAFHGALAGDGLSGVVPFPTPHRRRRRVVFAAAAAAVILVAAGSTVALRHDGNTAPSFKVLATSEARLRSALAAGDPAAIGSAADDLRSQLARLDTGDREKVGDEPDELLSRASEIKPDASTSGRTPARAGPPATTTATGVDDHGGGGDGDEHGGTVTTTLATPSTTSTTVDDHGGDDGSGHDGGGDSSGSGSGSSGPG